MASQVKDAAWLAWIERLVGQSARTTLTAIELPRSLFHCCLDDQPDHLAPQRCLLRPGHWEGMADRPFLVNPAAFFAKNGELPASEAAVLEALVGNFALQGEMVWVKDQRSEDPGSNVLLPFWLGPEFGALLSGLQPGDPAPAELSEKALSTLAMANVLVNNDYATECRRQWNESISICREQFQQKGYAPVGGLIHPFHISALRRYYRHLIRTGKLRLGDQQSSRRYVAHNESVARFFHHQLTSAVTEMAGEPVKPSYVYMASYQPGAILEKHTDREQCEFSLTLCLDYSPEPRNATPWPLYLHTPSGRTTVFQAIGDALLYRGRELPHSRDPLPQGHTSTSIFFHYVREGFEGKLD